MPLKLKLLEWLYELVSKHLTKAKKRYAAKAQHRRFVTHGCDIRCPGCKRWASDIESLEGMAHLSRPSFGSHIVCHACGTESYWNYEAAPVPLSCDSNGMPLTSKEKASTGETIPEPDPLSVAYNKAIEAAGWVHGELIERQREGVDLAEIDVADLLDRMKSDLGMNTTL